MGGVFDRDFTKSLIIRDFDDVLKNPFRYVHLFLLHTLLSKKISENRHARPVTEGPKLRCNTMDALAKFPRSYPTAHMKIAKKESAQQNLTS